jgi:Papain fold toxin 1, glutamine deamidase
VATDRRNQSVHDTDHHTTDRRPLVPDRPGAPGRPSRAEARSRAAALDGPGDPVAESEVDRPTDKPSAAGGGAYRGNAGGKDRADSATETVDKDVDQTLERVNPKFEWTTSAYSENCTSVTQAYELRRRGLDVEAGPLEPHLRSDQGGPGGRTLDSIEGPWRDQFVPGTKSEIEEAFHEPGARGIVYIEWNRGGAHVFNAENVDGKVRFVDGQPTPSVQDASHYFDIGSYTMYLRLDQKEMPDHRMIQPYIERQ